MNIFLRLVVIALMMASLVACGGRVPSPKTAQKVSISYFKSYGRKYKNSEFGGKNFDALAINSISELHFNTAGIDALVSLKDGRAMRTLLTCEKEFPRGWHITSWEKLQ